MTSMKTMDRRSVIGATMAASAGAAMLAGCGANSRPAAAGMRGQSLSTMPAGGVEGAIVQTETFDHMCLSARNLDLVADWYKRVFGFVETHRFDLPDYVGVEAELAYLRLGNMQLEIFGNAKAAAGRPEPMSFPETIAYTGFQHFCVRVDDMDATLEALEAAEIPIFLGPNTNTILNRTFIHIKDPEGNDVEIVKWEI